MPQLRRSDKVKAGPVRDINKLKYKALPAINQANTVLGSDYVAAHGTDSLLNRISEIIVVETENLESISIPKTSHLFLCVRAKTFIAQEFKNRFQGYDVFFEHVQPHFESEIDVKFILL